MRVRHIPFKEIQAATLAHAEQLLRDWFPAGRKVGHEFKIGNLRGDAGESMSINLNNGKWADFASTDSGYDLIDLRAAMKRTDRVAAARELAATLGIEINGQAGTAHTKPNGQAKSGKDDWHPMVPPPPGARPPDPDNFSGYSAVHEYHAPDDHLLFYVRRREASATERKQFHPLVYGTLNGKTGWHSKHPPSPKPLYGLNRLTVLPDAPVLLCEGEKAANAAQGLFPNYVCLSWCGGAKAARHADVTLLAGRDVIIWPDADEEGMKAAAELRKILPHARVLRVDDLPNGYDAADISPDDPDEWLRDHLPLPDEGRRESARDFAQERVVGFSDESAPDFADELVPGAEDDRPVIRYAAGKVDILTNRAEQSLLDANADIFTRAEQLVRPGYSEVQAADGRTTKAAGLYALKEAGLIEELDRAAKWQKFDKRSNEWRNIDPPPLIARVLAERKGRWKLRSVAGVIVCPTMRPDGTILSEPGYDPATRLYYIPDPAFRLLPIPEKPSREAAEAALELLSGLLSEFPFVTLVDRSVALSMLVSAIVRGALGMVPVHAFTAPTPGSGKSYLADVTSAITSGRRCPVITPGKSEEELEKRLGAMLLAGFQTISLDNISSELSGDALCQVAERPIVRIRILGKSETPECEFRGILIANGNNLMIAGDMMRRVLLGKLDAGVECPEDREFQDNPVKQVLKDRGKYVAAAMTVVRAYLAAGQPGKLKPLASYEEWSDLVRSALVWLGCADPVETMAETRASDPVLTTLRTVMEAWRALFRDEPQTAQQVAATFASGFDPNGWQGKEKTDLRAALAPVAAVRGIIDAVKLGYWLRKSKGRPVDGWKFTSEVGHAAINIWKVSRA